MSYTTGVYAAAVFDASLNFLINQKHSDTVRIVLPAGQVAKIHVNREADIFITQKATNDDEDVTRGCHIFAKTAYRKEDLSAYLSTINHTPHEFKFHNSQLYLYAGKGVGIITKKGLKVKPGFPAINPVPQSMIFEKWKDKICNNENLSFFSTIGVREGEELAPLTANPKLGILGGISILGTGGIVKPISVTAYLESIEAELSVAYHGDVKNIVLVLGNQSRELAKQLNYNDDQIVECGNFIFETIQKIIDFNFTELTIILGTGKACKLAQGFKNTHRKEGEVDLHLLTKWMIEHRPSLSNVFLHSRLNTTLDADEKLIEAGFPHDLANLLAGKAISVMRSWIPADCKLRNICIIVKGKETFVKREMSC